jgi:hypothetical protein
MVGLVFHFDTHPRINEQDALAANAFVYRWDGVAYHRNFSGTGGSVRIFYATDSLC